MVYLLQVTGIQLESDRAGSLSLTLFVAEFVKKLESNAQEIAHGYATTPRIERAVMPSRVPWRV
jgi:hypothetical protein